MKIKSIALFLLLSLSNVFAFEYDLKLSQGDLQTIIEKKFPYENRTFALLNSLNANHKSYHSCL